MLNIFPQPLCSGDTIPLKLSFTDQATGNPHNLTGSTVGATVKPEPGDNPDTEATWMQDIAGDATGIIQFYIAPLEAGDFWLDVKLWQTNGANNIRTTVLPPFQMHLIQSVTARITP